MEHHVLLNYQYIPENQFFRPKKKKKAGGENGEGSSALQPNEIEIIFRNHPSPFLMFQVRSAPPRLLNQKIKLEFIYKAFIKKFNFNIFKVSF